MSNGRHSFIAFYPSDWVAGTARMTPMQELVYFRVCVFNWDKGEPVPAGELPLMLGTIPDWRVVLLDLVHAGKLVESPDGSVANTRAMSAAREANDLWTKKSKGGKAGAEKTNGKKPAAETADATPVESAAETPAASPVETPVATVVVTEAPVPPHNHNQNQQEAAVTAPEVSRETREALKFITCLDVCQQTVYRELRREFPHGTDIGTGLQWQASGYTVEFVEPVMLAKLNEMKRKNQRPPKSLSFFTQIIADARAAAETPMPEGKTDDELVRIPAHLDARRKRTGTDSFSELLAGARGAMGGR